MTVSSTRAKHRSARRPATSLSAITQAATEQMNSVGRRTAVVAASSGLIVSMIGAAVPTAAGAVEDSQPTDKLTTVDLGAEARTALASSSAITVPDDATFVIDAVPVVVTPAPVAKAPEVREDRTSRTQDRAAASEQAAPAPAAAPVSAAPVSAAPASANGSSVISIAARYVGVPYVYGGSTPSGFDCSGFTAYVFGQLGISLPHSSSAQGQMGTRVSRDQAQPGDLVWTPGHIAIYAGDGMIVDAPRPGGTVQFRSMYQSNPTFIRL